MPLYVPKSASVALTAEQLKAIFKEQDADGNGRLTREELRKVYEKLGSRYPDWRVRRSLSHADTDGDGSISLDELDELVKYVLKLDGKREMTINEFKRWLKKLDADKDGRISREELADAVRGTGGWFARFKAKRGVRSVDSNGNGFIDESEFKNLVEFAEKHLGVRIFQL
ncbi:hypothetical protein LWI28_008180 [Acer negundo]|uniref:EF-hand domain-containing protein n=1 Tax=Acer negundo TaxID=4023 RepID=A0AAD5JIG5_ACENE|nr:hypothetical protein LWI28_008180 [Acer negundo]